MAEYIEREKAIKARGQSCTRNCSDCDFARDGDSWCQGEVFVTSLLQIPAADVREVVLCRDCKFAPIGENDGADLEWPCNEWPDRNPCPCKCEDNWHSHKPAPDFYCANGKRKDNQ